MRSDGEEAYQTMCAYGGSVARAISQVEAERVRAGHRLLVDGYVCEVVRVEPDALNPASGLGDVSTAAEETGAWPSRLRISFLNGGSLIVSPGQVLDLPGRGPVQPNDLQPAGQLRASDLASDLAAGRPAGGPVGGPAGAEGRSR